MSVADTSLGGILWIPPPGSSKTLPSSFFLTCLPSSTTPASSRRKAGRSRKMRRRWTSDLTPPASMGHPSDHLAGQQADGSAALLEAAPLNIFFSSVKACWCVLPVLRTGTEWSQTECGDAALEPEPGSNSRTPAEPPLVALFTERHILDSLPKISAFIDQIEY